MPFRMVRASATMWRTHLADPKRERFALCGAMPRTPVYTVTTDADLIACRRCVRAALSMVARGEPLEWDDRAETGSRPGDVPTVSELTDELFRTGPR